MAVPGGSPLPGGVLLKNVATGRCLAIPGGQTANGTWLVTWDCGSAANPEQIWYMEP
ncbi:RICIN domain-containing protein [Asanoa siamensis]|uniref:RICIN domain-containing protein n=1 Tax=Asanoa siamensis TaxID=926357 RepID=UPI001EF3BD0F|nr:RICIN domain-containing protein [Asanoa siamensis]